MNCFCFPFIAKRRDASTAVRFSLSRSPLPAPCPSVHDSIKVNRSREHPSGSANVQLTVPWAMIQGQPIETSLNEIRRMYDEGEKSIVVFKFSQLLDDQTQLQAHVKEHMSRPEGCIGPASEAALVYRSPCFIIPAIGQATMEEAQLFTGRMWRDVASYKKEWHAMVKNVMAGICSPLQARGVLFGSELGELGSRSKALSYTYYPHLILNEPEGRFWGMLGEYSWTPEDVQLEMSLRDTIALKHCSSVTSALTSEGEMIWQNASSMDLFGYHHTSQSLASPGSSSEQNAKFNFLDLSFGPDDGDKSLQAQMRSATASGETFRVTVEVKDQTLRSIIQLNEDQEMHLECQVVETRDTQSFQRIFIISQTDVTESIVKERMLEKAQKKLEQMTVKQNELIDTLQWVTEVGRTAGTKARAAQLIDQVKRQLSTANASNVTNNGEDEDQAFVTIEDFKTESSGSNVLGAGGFGRVFKTKWRGVDVAVKRMTLAAEQDANNRKQTMALMELAISSTLLHSNIVKTHSYSIRPIREPSDLKASNTNFSPFSYLNQPPSAFEIQIIMEYCDLGTLRSTFGILNSAESPNYCAVLDVALDVARGMQHLHSCNIIHADLKAPNILLQSSSDEAKGFVAKVSDFGLSLAKEDALSSHVSGFQHGTKSHMAPEILSGDGSHSNASDVYSYGILMFEIYRGIDAFSYTFHLNFDEMVILHNHRPTFPPGTPDGYKDLAMACWSHDPKERPSFEALVSILTQLRAEEVGETSPPDVSRFIVKSCPTIMPPPEPVVDGASPSARPQDASRKAQDDMTNKDKEFWEEFFGIRPRQYDYDYERF